MPDNRATGDHTDPTSSEHLWEQLRRLEARWRILEQERARFGLYTSDATNRELSDVYQNIVDLKARLAGTQPHLLPEADSQYLAEHQQMSLPRPGPVAPEDAALHLRFLPSQGEITLLWEADVLGRRASRFQMPYDPTDLAVIIKALNTLQRLPHPITALAFSEQEQRILTGLGLWSNNQIAAHTPQMVGKILFAALTADPHAEQALKTLRDHATAQGRSLNYVLHFPPEAVALAALPWELLWDDQAPLLLSRGVVANLVRYLDLDQALPPALMAGQKLHILEIRPHAGMPKELRSAEQAALSAVRTNLEQQGFTVEPMSPVTPGMLVDRLQNKPPVDVLHFYGQGRYTNGQGALLFDTPPGRSGNTWLSVDRLAALMGGIRLIVLNAGQSAMVSESGLLTGIAPALSAAGIPAVVAMQLTLPATEARRFAEVLYRSLARGNSLQQAVGQTRQALFVEEEEGVSWFVPTLTLRSRDLTPFYLIGPA